MYLLVLLMTLIPAAFAVIAVFCIRLYPLSAEQLEQIHADILPEQGVNSESSDDTLTDSNKHSSVQNSSVQNAEVK